MITDLMRGAADFIDAVNQALEERRAGFSEREAGDYLDAAGLADSMVPDEFADDVVDAEVHCPGCKCPSYCGCGREIYSEPEGPDGPTYWFHSDDDSPITWGCATVRDGFTSPAAADGCGRSGGADLDTGSAESRWQQQGDRRAEDVPPCGVYLAGDALPIRPANPIFCELPAAHAGEHISYKHPDRAIVRWPNAPVSVSHEDLAAHVAASIREFRMSHAGNFEDAADFIASGLLADHSIALRSK
ncbi:hypothetical protein BTO20_05785 [Mycobacterium dioxanotrophicus]|uniref:Uncharacterized protein n=1 Tax=Mycobacterium dioxanotrophicus TaxID=482462 RepID=A0A1Y0BZ22_9MYCO|nr:hypothetical protein [Mycobacterium dioxanotrophicus]ART68163.1 hypothetical protein BTO20_05785 [Mycobacterium dioxanotrophicus]